MRTVIIMAVVAIGLVLRAPLAANAQQAPPIPPSLMLDSGRAVYFEPSVSLSAQEREHFAKTLNPVVDKLPSFVRLYISRGLVVSVKLLDKEYNVLALGNAKPEPFSAQEGTYSFRRFKDAVDKLVVNLNTHQAQAAPAPPAAP